MAPRCHAKRQRYEDVPNNPSISIHLQNIPSDTDNDETRQEESNMTDLLNEEEINIMRFQDHEETSSFSRVDWSVRTNDERNTPPETETWRYVR